MPYIMNHPDIPGSMIEVMAEGGVSIWETSGWVLNTDETKKSQANALYPSADVFPSGQTPTTEPQIAAAAAQADDTAKVKE